MIDIKALNTLTTKLERRGFSVNLNTGSLKQNYQAIRSDDHGNYVIFSAAVGEDEVMTLEASSGGVDTVAEFKTVVTDEQVAAIVVFQDVIF